MVWGSNPGESKRFFSSLKLPDHPWSLLSLLLNEYWSSLGAFEQMGHKVNRLPPFSAEVKNG
jgi:hypothetical protein